MTRKISGKNKPFRLIVCISYGLGNRPINYRDPLFDIFCNLAWLYAFDYAIQSDLMIEVDQEEPDDPKTLNVDLIQFRSTEYTRISSRDFRALIKSLFNRSVPIFQGVDIGFLKQRFMKRFPFPDDYNRPLVYPYIERFSGGKSKVCIIESSIYDLIISEGKPSSN